MNVSKAVVVASGDDEAWTSWLAPDRRPRSHPWPKQPEVRVIPSRWVTNHKPDKETKCEKVRSRIVIKDIAARAASARSLGISSPTLSCEGLFLLVTCILDNGGSIQFS